MSSVIPSAACPLPGAPLLSVAFPLVSSMCFSLAVAPSSFSGRADHAFSLATLGGSLHSMCISRDIYLVVISPSFALPMVCALLCQFVHLNILSVYYYYSSAMALLSQRYLRAETHGSLLSLPVFCMCPPNICLQVEEEGEKDSCLFVSLHMPCSLLSFNNSSLVTFSSICSVAACVNVLQCLSCL